MRCLIPKFSLIAILCFLTEIPLTAQSQVIPPGERIITYTAQRIRIKDLFETVWEQTRLQAFYNDEQLDSYEIISVDFQNIPLDKALAQLLNKRGLTWSYRKETFVIFPRKKDTDTTLTRIGGTNTRSVTGIVSDEKMRPLPGVSVFTDTVAGITDKNGKFLLAGVKRGSILQVRKSGYKPMLLSSYADSIRIQLIALVAPLQLIDVSGVQQTQLTASISSVTAKDIERQPANNVLSILQGRIPGLYINQTTGLPGGGYKIRLRGRNSIQSVSDPLILVDGVPFPSVSLSNYPADLGIMPGANIAASPLNLLSINDIASIEVLKDAEATAVYGVKGANGIIAITSKTPKPGERSVSVNVYSGVGRATKLIRFLDSKQYTEMRRQAKTNDSTTASAEDYDINVWDTTKYTDWQKKMIGGTAHITDGSFEIKQGGQNWFWRASGLYRQESTVYPFPDFKYRKGSGRFQINHISKSKKLKVAASVNYVADRNVLPSKDLIFFSTIPPTAPDLYPGGKLSFVNNFANNPYVYLSQTSTETSSNWHSFIKTKYEPSADWQLKAEIGLNSMKSTLAQVYPLRSFNPVDSIPAAYSNFVDNRFRTTMLDISSYWKKEFNNIKVSFLAGGRSFWDHQLQEGIQAYFSNDDLVAIRSAAKSSYQIFKPDSNFYYTSVYSRMEIKKNDKYVLTFTVSRDQSNRLDRRVCNVIFGTASAAWIFSRESWFRDSSFFSYGRLRGSWGYSGNDQYQEKHDEDKLLILNAVPDSLRKLLVNTPPHWEKIRKAEIGVELGFLNDNVTGTISYYNNKSSNQLLTTVASSASGVGIPVNYPAVIVNSGIEVDVAAKWFRSNHLTINSSVNLSFPRTKLLEFPYIDDLSYRKFYRIGAPLDVVLAYGLEGVDAITGLYKFTGGVSTPDSMQRPHAKGLDPIFYGGFQHNITYKGFQLDILFRFARQNNYNYDFGLAQETPGTMYNQPVGILNRWQKEGDHAPVQRFTTSMGSAAGGLYNMALSSDKRISEVTYLRLQSLMLGYQLPDKFLKKVKLSSCRLYLQGINLFTITNYRGRDPELNTTQDVYPSLRIMTAGMQVCF